MHRNSFYVCVGGNYFELGRSNKGHFDRKTWVIILSTLNHTETRNLAIICNKNIKQIYVVLAAIFCFAYLKVNDTKDRMFTNICKFSTPKLCKNKRKKYLALKCRAKIDVLYFSPAPKYTHFHKKAAIFSHLKIHIPCTNINDTQFGAIHFWVQKT